MRNCKAINYLHALTLVCSILCAGVARAEGFGPKYLIDKNMVAMRQIQIENSTGTLVVTHSFSSGTMICTIDDFVKSGKFCEIYGHGYILQTVIEQRCRYCGIHRNDDLEDRKRCELRERRYRP